MTSINAQAMPTNDIDYSCYIKLRGGSRLLKGGAQLDLSSFDIELAGIYTVIVCEAHGHVKHANTREVWGHAPQEILKNYTL